MKMRQFIQTDAEVVHTTCQHGWTKYDRFGDEVCAECHATIRVGVVAPNEGCE